MGQKSFGTISTSLWWPHRSLRHVIVPVEMFSQIFMTRCLGVARSSEAKCTFRPSAICQRYLTYDFTHFGQLYNQLGRRMHTMVMNSLCVHMNSRHPSHSDFHHVYLSHTDQECVFVCHQWTLSGAPDTSCR